MQKTSATFVCVLILGAFTISPASAKWDHRVDSAYEAEENAEKHPGEIIQTLAMPSGVDGKVYVCVGYGRNFKKSLRNKGKVKADIEISRADADGGTTTESLTLAKKIKNNTFVMCEKTGDIAEDDIVSATYAFENMPRMRAASGKAGINVITAVAPEELTADDFFGGGDNPGTSPPPATDGSLSAEDQAGIVKLRQWVRTGRGVQIRMQPPSRHYVDARSGGFDCGIRPIQQHCRRGKCVLLQNQLRQGRRTLEIRPGFGAQAAEVDQKRRRRQAAGFSFRDREQSLHRLHSVQRRPRSARHGVHFHHRSGQRLLQAPSFRRLQVAAIDLPATGSWTR